eukprot:GILI01011854.1.p1 GENE.GILI01011854.1~~GILI01011854.1.p1  ORF type:complete len:352 (+),score=79.87 GILI01011854.1:123-1178(+)
MSTVAPGSSGPDLFARAAAILSRPPLQKVPNELFDSYGHHFEAIFQLYPVLIFIPMFFFLRKFCKALVFPPVARYFGITGKVVPKFSYQGWLLLFYTTSTIYGYICLHDKPWVSYPLGESQKREMGLNFRSTAHNEIVWYYSYQIGFFFAELYAICTETKRSDFLEYLIHHIVTLYLMIFSWAAYEHRVGSYVLIIHDAVDIFLCLSKMAHYIKVRDLVMFPTFISFVVSYAFFRMFCLPVLSYELLTVTRFEHSNFASSMLGFILAFVLQALHVFWFYLILRVIYKMFVVGVNEDVRSDEDEDEPSAMVKEKKEDAAEAASINAKKDALSRKNSNSPSRHAKKAAVKKED